MRKFSFSEELLVYMQARFCPKVDLLALTRVAGMLAVFALAAMILSAPDSTFAQTSTGTGTGTADDGISAALCNVIGVLTGSVGRGVAVIAVVFLGFSLFLGKVSWGLALALAIGIAAIFGADKIVNLVSGSKDKTC